MAREYARVRVAIWADTDFRLLSDRAQALYFRLLSSPTMTLCGVADWRPNRLAALTEDMTPAKVRNAASELIDKGYIVVDEETEEVLVRSFVRHDGLIKTPNIAAAMAKDYAGTASAYLRGVVIHELRRLKNDEPEMKGWATASKLLSEPAIDPSEMASPRNPSPNPSGKACPNPSGTRSHIPHPASLNQQPASSRNAAALDDDPDFGAFWSAYPRRTAKGEARKAWLSMLKRGAEPTDVIKAAEEFATRVASSDPKFIPHPATWLNQERYDDETAAAAQPQGEPPPNWMEQRKMPGPLRYDE